MGGWKYEVHGLERYTLERYLGHAEGSITDKFYGTLSEDKRHEIPRLQVVPPINRILRTFRANRHQNGTLDKVLIV